MVVYLPLQTTGITHALGGEVIFDGITRDMGVEMMSIFDKRTTPPTPPKYYKINDTLQHTETAMKNHKLTCWIRILQIHTKKTNSLPNIVIVTRSDIFSIILPPNQTNVKHKSTYTTENYVILIEKGMKVTNTENLSQARPFVEPNGHDLIKGI